jgi:NitT/TauT family transport system permease protein
MSRIRNARSGNGVVSRVVVAALPVAVALVFWHLLSVMGIFNPKIIPGPVQTLRAIEEAIRVGQLARDTADSLRRVFVGYALAACLAVPLGMIGALKPRLGYWMRPIVEVMRPIPPIAWIPISLFWFGFGDPPAYFLVGLGGVLSYLYERASRNFRSGTRTG